MRIARALAMAGVNSRRKCEEYILRGEVTVNGEVVQDLGRQVSLEHDEIMFRGRLLTAENFVYFILHKPVGFITTASDVHAEKTVFDLLPANLVAKNPRSKSDRTRIFPVGRLDKDSSGLLFFTNDGNLGNQLTHPRFEVGKWYLVRLDKAFDQRDGQRILEGVELEDGLARAQKVQCVSKRILKILIQEGRNREVRRIFEALGYEVTELCRIAFGPMVLGKLPVGRGRYLTPPEVKQLKTWLKEQTASVASKRQVKRRFSR